MKKLNVGLIGYGFMGRAHSNAYLTLSQFFDLKYRPVLKAVAARDAEKVKQFAHKWGYESHYSDWRKLIDDPAIEVVDIASPNDTHAEIAVAALEAGKMVLSEKPLARNLTEAQRMVDAAKKAGTRTMVWYNYRRIPAVTLAKRIIASGKLGRIFHYRAKFLQDWTISASVPQGGTSWRLDVDVAGSGVTGDLLAHCIDTAIWLNGEMDSVSAVTETFIKEREHQITGKMTEVGI